MPTTARRAAALALGLLLPGCSGCGAPPPPPPAPPPVPPESREVPLPASGADLVMDSFDGAAGAAPAGWKGLRGRWVLTEDPSAARGPSVLLQDAEADPWAVLLRDGSYAGDLRVSVRFRPVSGREDASGGIALRAQDPRNYLLVRANALEGNLRLYRITDDRREMLASAETAPPALGAWHTLEVVLRRGTATCLLDGRPLLAHPVGDAWPAGRVGLWTKADSRTAFDDFTVLRLKESGE